MRAEADSLGRGDIRTEVGDDDFHICPPLHTAPCPRGTTYEQVPDDEAPAPEEGKEQAMKTVPVTTQEYEVQNKMQPIWMRPPSKVFRALTHASAFCALNLRPQLATLRPYPAPCTPHPTILDARPANKRKRAHTNRGGGGSSLRERGFRV